MALIEANRLTVTLPGGPEDPPDEAVAAERIHTWLEGRYGYRPPVEHLEGHGWSERWEVGDAPAPGWRFDAVIPRHLGPAPAASSPGRSRAEHPANAVRVPPVAASRSTAAARAGRARARAGARDAARAGSPTTGRVGAPARGGATAARPSTAARDAALLHRLDTLFPDLVHGAPAPAGAGGRRRQPS